MTQDSLRLRYPGTQPFSSAYQDLFFGRETAVRELMQRIRTASVTVLHGPSGLGKSSLLNARMIPILSGTLDESLRKQLMQERLALRQPYVTLPVRMQSYDPRHPEQALMPLDRLAQALQAEEQTQDSYLRQIQAGPAPTLWQHCRQIMLQRPDHQGILLVFDQFEELFTYPEAAVQAFSAQLAALLNDRMPDAETAALEALLSSRPDALPPEAAEDLGRPLSLRVLIAIRSDYASLLDRLAADIPYIQRNNYELRALSPEEAREAIVRPAAAEGAFQSPAFAYEPEALDALLAFLGAGRQRGGVETIQLQLLCNHLEVQQVMGAGRTRLAEADLGDLQEVVDSYYRSRIAALGDAKAQRQARILIEEHMIFGTRRLTLIEGVVRQYADAPVLKALLDCYLLRADADVQGGLVYEISHDGLVPSIARAREARRAEEQAEAERQAREAEAAEAQRRREAEARQAEYERARRDSRRNARLSVLFGVLMLAATGATIWALYQQNKLQAINQAFLTGFRNLMEQYEFAQAAVYLKQTMGLGGDPQESLYFAAELISAYRYADTVQAIELIGVAGNHLDKLLYRRGQEQRWIDSPAGTRSNTITGQSVPLQQWIDSVLIYMAPGDSLALWHRRYNPELVPVPGGTFFRGEDPNYQVTLSDFEIGRTEVTWRQYALFCRSTGRDLPEAPDWGRPADHPVVNVSWEDAGAYCEWLSRQTGWRFRLPTEAEWEYAAGGGATGRTEYAGTDRADELEDYAWYSANSGGQTHPVKQKQPNALGLYDMSGNVWEWCQDWYGEYPAGPQTNPAGPASRSYRVRRGGSWDYDAEFCRVADRFNYIPARRNFNLGFRLSRTP
ncbi:MAG: SUMF1/EgtB/PvdO family nonheme iron enzyme [Bacteroidia bacterium]|nr:SUMF1/EgtB/PvdO family nonheme iron enzyme [Bacteroidia bacterium]